jgi:hypothetical protein
MPPCNYFSSRLDPLRDSAEPVVVQFVDLAGREGLGEEHGLSKTLVNERNHINTSEE